MAVISGSGRLSAGETHLDMLVEGSTVELEPARLAEGEVVLFSKPGYQTASMTLPVQPGRYDVVLEAAGSLTLRVTCGAEPVTNVQFQISKGCLGLHAGSAQHGPHLGGWPADGLSPPSGTGIVMAATTDTAGEVEFTFLEPGMYEVKAVSREYLTWNSVNECRVEVSAGTNVLDIETSKLAVAVIDNSDGAILTADAGYARNPQVRCCGGGEIAEWQAALRDRFPMSLVVVVGATRLGGDVDLKLDTRYLGRLRAMATLQSVDSCTVQRLRFEVPPLPKKLDYLQISLECPSGVRIDGVRLTLRWVGSTESYALESGGGRNLPPRIYRLNSSSPIAKDIVNLNDGNIDVGRDVDVVLRTAKEWTQCYLTAETSSGIVPRRVDVSWRSSQLKSEQAFTSVNPRKIPLLVPSGDVEVTLKCLGCDDAVQLLTLPPGVVEQPFKIVLADQ